MRVLVACEFSGVVRDAFAARGHDAWSCDLVPSLSPGNHIKGNVLRYLGNHWDLMVAHPPCTYLCRSGSRWWKGREHLQSQALDFVRRLMDAPIPRIALENPPGCIGTRIRPADQYVQPWQFGHDACKMTGLWLKNLPPLVPTQVVEGRLVDGKRRWANQTDSGQDRIGPGENRPMERSKTYAGIARAMAEQWG